jgi:hypothetical protein
MVKTLPLTSIMEDLGHVDVVVNMHDRGRTGPCSNHLQESEERAPVCSSMDVSGIGAQ